MGKVKLPSTPALRMLREAGVAFEPAPYRYADKGGTALAAAELGLDEHAVIKTLVFETDARDPIIVLMHGDRSVSLKEMARILSVKSVTPCDPKTANKHTGYMVGGISPFGTRRKLPVYVEETILDLPDIWINAGKRGLLLRMSAKDLAAVLDPVPVQVAVAGN